MWKSAEEAQQQNEESWKYIYHCLLNYISDINILSNYENYGSVFRVHTEW